jgi:NAD-dependent DNA ligase
MNQKLKQYLDLASQAYYAGKPFISDAEFDALADSCGYSQVGASASASASGVTGRHYKQMYSLQKFYEDEGSTRPLQGISDVSASIKLDGAAISLLYIDGGLVRALTRGDGTEGQDITDKILASAGAIVPVRIDCARAHGCTVPSIFQVTGEIVAPLNIENARNYAAGALNLKSVTEFCERALSFYAYGVWPYFTRKYNTDMTVLESLGFNTVKALDLEKIFPSDGMVFRANNNAQFEELGYTSKHPRGAYALKIRGQHVETKLLDVEWQVGKSGKVTPVAILEPVYIGDALVSRATLNNPGFIEALGLEIGDTIAVIRAGEIIPCITHKVES